MGSFAERGTGYLVRGPSIEALPAKSVAEPENGNILRIAVMLGFASMLICYAAGVDGIRALLIFVGISVGVFGVGLLGLMVGSRKSSQYLEIARALVIARAFDAEQIRFSSLASKRSRSSRSGEPAPSTAPSSTLLHRSERP